MVILVALNAQLSPVNTHHRGKYQCTSDLLFDWFRFDQTSKTVVNTM